MDDNINKHFCALCHQGFQVRYQLYRHLSHDETKYQHDLLARKYKQMQMSDPSSSNIITPSHVTSENLILYLIRKTRQLESNIEQLTQIIKEITHNNQQNINEN